MMRTIVIDDEQHARETVVRLLGAHCPDVQVVAEAASIPSALQCIEQHHPDLVLLDIKLPGGNGFELLASVPTVNFGVIFVTAYDRYAIRAIKVAALDYVLKPVEPFELQRAVQKARAALLDPTAQQHRHALAREHGIPHEPRKLLVPTSDGFIVVPTDELVRCRAVGNYTTLHLTNRREVLSSRTLGDYETMLADLGFCRVHNSHLVNLHHARRYVRGKGGTLELSDGSTVEVSSRRKEQFLEEMKRLGE